MPIEIDGITYEQPQDKATATYAQIEGVLGYSGNAGKRVAKAELSDASHNHDNLWIYPAHILRGTSTAQLIINSRSGSLLKLYDTGGVEWTILSGKTFDVLGKTRIRGLAGMDWALELTGTLNYRKAVADQWALYACSISDKENIEEISDPVAKIKNLRGLTFTRDGVPATGMVVEDMDKTGLPGIVQKVGAKIESFNPFALLSLVISTLRELVARVEALEARASK